MRGLELTFKTLATTRNEAAVDVLQTALLEPDRTTRRWALEALLSRGELRCRSWVLSHWNLLDEENIDQIRDQKKWIEPAIRDMLCSPAAELSTAISAARQLEMLSVVPEIIRVAESADCEANRQVALDAVLAMTEPLGTDARMDRDHPSVRSPILSRLAESVRRFADHGSSQLLDAFLSVVTWGDGELRQLLDPESPTAQPLLIRLFTSDRRPVVELLAGFIRRRRLPDSVAVLLARRSDDAFREALLRNIGADPCETVLRNLKRIGTPICCRGDESLLIELKPEGRAALAHLAAVTQPDPIRAMHLICAVIDYGGRGCEQAAASALAQCQVPDIEQWMRAAAIIAEGSPDRIRSHELAWLLDRMIPLLQHDNPVIVRGIRRVLAPLHAEQILPRFDALRPRSRRRLGRVVLKVDPTVIDRVRERLRHPVLAQRLQAISAADGLEAVDTLVDAFRPIARADHQEARRRTALVLADANGKETYELLQEMAKLPDSTVRDTAVDALASRESRQPADHRLSSPPPVSGSVPQPPSASHTLHGLVAIDGFAVLYLAQSRMGDISRQFQTQGSPHHWSVQVGFILIPAAAVGLAWLIYRLYHRPATTVHTPFGMLSEICRVHQLPRSSRRLLERIAEHAELEMPAWLTLGEGPFDQAVAAAESRTRLDSRDRERLREIRQRLF